MFNRNTRATGRNTCLLLAIVNLILLIQHIMLQRQSQAELRANEEVPAQTSKCEKLPEVVKVEEPEPARNNHPIISKVPWETANNSFLRVEPDSFDFCIDNCAMSGIGSNLVRKVSQKTLKH